MDDNVVPKIKEPPVLAHWNNPRGGGTGQAALRLVSLLHIA
jgi:hypothetical protein